MSGDERGRARSGLDWAADRMLSATVLERLGIAVASTVTALLIGVIIVAIATRDVSAPIVFMIHLFEGSFGSTRALTRTLRLTTLFVLTGVAVAIAFRAGVFNIGVQGQFIMGGIACTMSVLWLAPLLPSGPVGGVILMLIGTLAAFISGGLYGAFPGVLKAYADANEIITTIMLNFIAIGVVGWLVSGWFREDGATQVRTDAIPEYAELPQVVFGDSSFSIIGLVFMLAVVAVVAIIMTRTSFGYDMVTSGYQASAATYSGVQAKQTIVTTMTLSGGVAGLAGAVYVLMMQGRYLDPAGIHTYGFDAIAVSLLAANNPIGVLPAGLLFGGLNSAGSHIQIYSDIPVFLIDGIVGIVVLFVAAPELFRMIAKRTGLGGEDR